GVVVDVAAAVGRHERVLRDGGCGHPARSGGAADEGWDGCGEGVVRDGRGAGGGGERERARERERAHRESYPVSERGVRSVPWRRDIARRTRVRAASVLCGVGVALARPLAV